LFLVCVVLAAGTTVAIWLAYWQPKKGILILANVLDGLFLLIIIGAMLSHVFQTRRITRETIAGAICAYLLLAATWANVFSMIEHLRPGSFANLTVNIAEDTEKASLRRRSAEFSYFSFVTLSTLGYGDITPLTRSARNLAALEAIFGQLYLAVLIARLVGQYSAMRPRMDLGGPEG
jgi:hypothetical protein